MKILNAILALTISLLAIPLALCGVVFALVSLVLSTVAALAEGVANAFTRVVEVLMAEARRRAELVSK